MKDKYKYISGLILIIICITLIYITKDNKTQEDKICEMLGFNKSTDYKPTMNDLFRQVECDNIIQEDEYHVYTIKARSCIEVDKWGDCKDYNKTKYEVLLKGSAMSSYEINRWIKRS